MSVAKYKMELSWKEFSLNLADCEVQFKALGGEHYCGNQAHGVLELWFLEEPSQEVKDALSAYWDGLEASDSEATSYYPAADLQTAIQLAKEDAATKGWDALSTQQKKMISGAALTSADQAALLAAF